MGDVWSSPALGDIDGDGQLEVVVGSDDNKIYALNHDGTNVLGWHVTTGDSVRSSAALGDIDNDGLVEIVVGSFDYNIYAFKGIGSYNPFRYPWPQFHHNEWNTGLFIDKFPTCNQPSDITTSQYGSEMIHWILYDDFGRGEYRVLVNDTNGNFYVWVDWAPWTHNIPIYVPVNKTSTGIYNYTIEFITVTGQISTDTVIVTIMKPQLTLESFLGILNILMGAQGTGDILTLLLTPVGLGIILVFIAVFVIMAIILINNNRTIKELNNTIKELNEKMDKRPVSKKNKKFSNSQH